MIFPELNNTNFEKNIFDYFAENNKDYQSLISEGNRCQFNKNSKKTITLAQLFLKNFAEKLLNNDTNRGLLCWHSTGSGKTCLATGAMEAFKGKRVIYLTSVDAKKANPPDSFYECASSFFPQFKKKLDSSKKDNKNMEAIFKKNNIHFHSFATLTHLLGIYKPLKKSEPNFLKDSLIIIDEIHQIFKPLPNQKKEHDALKEFLLNINSDNLKNTKLLILTATPGGNKEDIIMLLNMIRKVNSPQITLPDLENEEKQKKFSDDIRGLISYFDASLDFTKFPKLYQYPLHTTFMSSIIYSNNNSVFNNKDKPDKQFLKYLEKSKEVKEENKDYESLMNKNELNKYYKTLRKYSNMLFNHVNDMSLNEFSSKIPYMFEKIETNPKQKHYIYSAFFESRGFGQSIVGIGKLLEKHMEYKKFTLSQANTIKNLKDIGKDKRYILIGTTNLDDKSDSDIKKELLKVKKLLKFYNDPINKNGEYIQLLLASKQFNESIDLKAVRHMHIFEPLVSWISRKQLLGRAVRHCSHSNLDKSEWNVKLHEYISEKPHDIKMYNTEFLQKEIEFMSSEIEKQNRDILEYSFKSKTKNKNISNFNQYYKNRVKRKKEIIKKLEKRKKELESMFQNKELEMINTKVYNIAKNKFKEIALLEKTMIESSIDCNLFKDFHNKYRDEKVVCKFGN
jgi:hypothetical protein|tara:strand:+ start:2542 stop:4575 length:2034 start_codon:yes stop_codon:yes gene_type:complete